MRNLFNQHAPHVRRSGDPVDVTNSLDEPASLGSAVISMARVATSIHLARAAQLRASASQEHAGQTHVDTMRERPQ